MTHRYTELHLKADERPQSYYVYYVTGRGEFPTDMLRYDRCWPADSDSAVLLVPFSMKAYRSLKIYSYQTPTEARWGSFGWSVGKEKL